MPAGRPRKPIAEKKLKGTYRADRHSEQDELEKAFAAVSPFDENTVIEIPKEIKDATVRKSFEQHLKMLCSMHLLQESDLDQLLMMYLALQRLHEIEKQLQKIDISENFEAYEKLIKLQMKLMSSYNDLAKLYYISPVARTKLQLDTLEVTKKKTEATSAIGKLLAKK